MLYNCTALKVDCLTNAPHLQKSRVQISCQPNLKVANGTPSLQRLRKKLRYLVTKSWRWAPLTRYTFWRNTACV